MRKVRFKKITSSHIKYVISAFLFISLIATLFITVNTLTAQKYEIIESDSKKPGQILDLSDYPFENIAYIKIKYLDWYPNVYYTPENFSNGEADTAAAISLSDRDKKDQYGTMHIRLRLPPNQVYSISSHSANYAQRLYINGIEYPSVGTPGTSKETNIAKTNHYIAAFQPDNDLVEIIVHFSNFVHTDGGGLMPLYLGHQFQITQAYQASQLRIIIMVGCMMTICLLFFGLFLFFPRQKHLLWFSLTCMMMTVRTLIVEQKTIMILFPNLSWEISIRMEYLVLVGLLLFLPLYIHHFFGRPLGKWIIVAEALFSSWYTLLVLFTPTNIFTRYLLIYQYGSIILGLIILAFCIRNTIQNKTYRSAEHLLTLIAIIIFAAISIPDVHLHSLRGILQYKIHLTQAGMMLFIFINMLAQILGFFRTENELLQARQAERELQAEKNLLDKLNALKNNYLGNITHEMKTPLSVMAGYAQLTRWQIEKGTADADTLENLKTVSSEAHRLAKMAEQLLKLSVEQENVNSHHTILLQDICTQVTRLCEPLLSKKKNKITLEIEKDCPSVRIHPDSMIQVLLNLISNANRHTEEGIIHLTLKHKDDQAVLTLLDNGQGIPPEQIPHLFDRGSSPDGRTGLGLSISKEMIENSGGQIHLESNLGTGTTVTITLPLNLTEHNQL